jgi:hypothetical protein
MKKTVILFIFLIFISSLTLYARSPRTIEGNFQTYTSETLTVSGEIFSYGKELRVVRQYKKNDAYYEDVISLKDIKSRTAVDVSAYGSYAVYVLVKGD